METLKCDGIRAYMQFEKERGKHELKVCETYE